MAQEPGATDSADVERTFPDIEGAGRAPGEPTEAAHAANRPAKAGSSSTQPSATEEDTTAPSPPTGTPTDLPGLPETRLAPAGHSDTHAAPIELSDLAALKALAQPRRQRMLQHLTVHGPATSATLARALGLNTGATSYHLRELARYGFVEETGDAGHGRERWWRAIPGDRRFPPRSRQSPEMRLVMDDLNHHAYAADLELFEQLQRDAADGPWADAFPYSRGTVRLTLPELREFFEEYIALLNRYKRPETDTPAGARTVLTRFLAFPTQTDPQADSARDSAPDNGRETGTS